MINSVKHKSLYTFEYFLKKRNFRAKMFVHLQLAI